MNAVMVSSINRKMVSTSFQPYLMNRRDDDLGMLGWHFMAAVYNDLPAMGREPSQFRLWLVDPKIFLRLCVLRRNLGRDVVLSRRREHHQRAIAEISGDSHLCRAQRGENLILIDYGELMFGLKRQELFFLAECSRPEVRRIAVCCQASPAKMKLKEVFQLLPTGTFAVGPLPLADRLLRSQVLIFVGGIHQFDPHNIFWILNGINPDVVPAHRVSDENVGTFFPFRRATTTTVHRLVRDNQPR